MMTSAKYGSLVLELVDGISHVEILTELLDMAIEECNTDSDKSATRIHLLLDAYKEKLEPELERLRNVSESIMELRREIFKSNQQDTALFCPFNQGLTKAE